MNEYITRSQVQLFCRRFNFIFDENHDSYIIKSNNRMDTWYILKNSHLSPIKLWHENHYGPCNKHPQITCNDLQHVFKYIKGHDNKAFKANDKVFKIKAILDSLKISKEA